MRYKVKKHKNGNFSISSDGVDFLLNGESKVKVLEIIDCKKNDIVGSKLKKLKKAKCYN